MKQIIKKVLYIYIYMISTLVLSMLLSSLQRVSADESENILKNFHYQKQN